MARGLATPMPLIMVGVIGGTIAYGIVGLSFGPIVLSVAWAVMTTWVRGGDVPEGEDCSQQNGDHRCRRQVGAHSTTGRHQLCL
jgi:predicted PurR-regulated permease PerM